jgi:hypothetical protein
MNLTPSHQWEAGNWLAFFFGAIFNLFADIEPRFLLDYTLQAIVGGIVCLGFKLLGDYISSQKALRHKNRRRK